MSDLVPVCACDSGSDSVLGVACLFPLRAPSSYYVSVSQCVSVLHSVSVLLPPGCLPHSQGFPRTLPPLPHPRPRPQQTRITDPGALRSSLYGRFPSTQAQIPQVHSGGWSGHLHSQSSILPQTVRPKARGCSSAHTHALHTLPHGPAHRHTRTATLKGAQQT